MVVATGAILGQFITIAFMPIITRLYTPEAMGIQSVFLSIGNILTTSAALTYPLALTLPKEDIKAAYLIVISLLFGLATSLLVFLVIAFFHEYILNTFDELGVWIYLIPFYVFFSVLGMISSQCLIREKNFKAIARTSWELSAILNFLKIVGGMFYPFPVTLIIANIFSGVVRCVLSTRFLTKQLKNYIAHLSNGKNYSNSIETAKIFRDFPYYRAPQAIVAALSQSLPLIIISTLFDAGIAGQFSLAFTVLSLPANFIGAAVSQVLYPMINDSLREGKQVTEDILRITLIMALIGAPVFLGIALLGEQLFVFAFGKSWNLAGEFSKWLAVYMFIDFISRPSITIIPILGRQKGLLGFEIVFFFIKCVVLYLGFLVHLSSLSLVSLFSTSCAVVCLAQICWAVRATYSKLH